MHYDAAHQWYYLQDQEPLELLVLRQADSHPDGRVGESELSSSFLVVDHCRLWFT